MPILEMPYSFYGGVHRAIMCKDPEVMLSGPAETGKTIGLLWKLDAIARKYKNASLVIARKTLASTYSTVLVTFQEKILQDGTGVKPYGGARPQWFDYEETGSRIWITGMDKSSKALSAGHDVVYVNQAEEFVQPDWEILTTRTTGRAGHIPFPQTIGDCNPGPPMHWIRSRARSGALTFFESTHRDNPTLFDPRTGEITPQGERTLSSLDKLTGSRHARLFRGLWAAPEGAIYDFDESLHKVKSFAIPQMWPKMVGIDPSGAYVVALWLAFDPLNHVLNVYREYYAPFGASTSEHATEILKLSQGETIFVWIGGGPSERGWRNEWTAAGIPLLAPPISDVWQGIGRVADLLDGRALVVHETCTNLLSEVGSYVRKQSSATGKLTDRIVNKDEFHALDALRYIVAFLAEPYEKTEIVYNLIPIGVY